MSGGAISGLASGIFGALFSGINNWITGKRNDSNAKELGASKAREVNAAAAAAEVDTARRAGDAVRTDLDRDPDRVREPDTHAARRGDDGIS